ncbi:crotonase/enoyl-CoA hydratase family protein [Rhodococcus sp. G-MC3]|uniref:crotonase/enoyl-CoA hydratase family protein n=1 Tax=Rhodococcus sp. G-MC3 TaxID=3046209 RepID=UPI0024B8D70F|nr:crotonase/enoyl-CoA hydratase family protein [Rhodococcus sp. G-MC3]MDJ0395846.1 crotonase/enoyl-CoA hydratase family protein [Rhodococcus sp. G-MC3]
MSDWSSPPAVTVEREGHVLLMGLNRPNKRNAVTKQLLTELAQAYGKLESDESLWCGVLFAHGQHFTGGLDLADVGADLAAGTFELPAGARDPWRLDDPWTKPVVAAAHGWVMTLGIELLLAADIVIASADARFKQMENRRGIYPFGGASFRFPQTAGWGNAMRWILTGDEFDADEAYRIGLVQEIAPDPTAALATARAIAATIAERCAPLGVQTTLASAHRARLSGEQAAIEQLRPDIARLLRTADGVEGMRSFIERRDAVFTGN